MKNKPEIQKRRKAREDLLGLLFETEFRQDESFAGIYATAAENEDRGLSSDLYVKEGYDTICQKRDEIDAVIGAHANGWKTGRMTRLSRSVLRIAVYEMLFVDDIPYVVSINEAVELAKKYDDDKARPFINGVLNAVKADLEAQNKIKTDEGKPQDENGGDERKDDGETQ